MTLYLRLIFRVISFNR